MIFFYLSKHEALPKSFCDQRLSEVVDMLVIVLTCPSVGVDFRQNVSYHGLTQTLCFTALPHYQKFETINALIVYTENLKGHWTYFWLNFIYQVITDYLFTNTKRKIQKFLLKVNK